MIVLDGVRLVRGEKTVLQSLSATLPERGVIALLGPSGSGKTTLLRLFAGLLSPAGGSFSGMEGKRVSIVFQEDRLLPWLDAAGNVALVEGARSVEECLAAVELSECALKLPAVLSGGMQRRVAIARALRYGGDALVLDEPFKGLDDALKARIATKLATAFPLIVIATHDEKEAALLGSYAGLEVSSF